MLNAPVMPSAMPAHVPITAHAPWALPDGVAAVDVNGYPMAYVERGAGQTIVLVHGSLSDYRYWDPQVAEQFPGFRLVAVSLRHFYPEPWDGTGEDFSIEQHAADVAAFIEQLDAGPVHLVAWSRGGGVALGAVKQRPGLVKKLVLMEPVIACLAPQAAEPGRPDPAVERLNTVGARYARGDIEGGLEYFVDQINGPGAWKARTPEQRRLALDNAWTLARQVTDTDVVAPDDLRHMRMPVLLIGGERGPQFLAQTMDAAQVYFASARRTTIPNAGHRMNLDNPTEFNRTLFEFLTR